MLEIQLFLGFPILPSYEKALEQVNSQVLALFINEQENYLREVFFNNQRYFGKFAGLKHDIGGLEHLELNIYSLLKKILPTFPYEESSLVLFAIPNKY